MQLYRGKPEPTWAWRGQEYPTWRARNEAIMARHPRARFIFKNNGWLIVRFAALQSASDAKSGDLCYRLRKLQRGYLIAPEPESLEV